MKECKFIKKKIYGYISNLLDSDDTERINGHLAVCKDCSRELDRLKQIIEAASSDKRYELSDESWEEFDRELVEKVSEQHKEYVLKPKRNTFPGMILKPALVVLVLALVVFLGSSSLINNVDRQDIMLSETEEELLYELELLDELDVQISVNGYTDEILDEIDDMLLEEMELLDSFEVS